MSYHLKKSSLLKFKDYFFIRCRQVSAFTLLEFSIAIVVVALLMGAILEGRVMLRSAALADITKQQYAFSFAAKTFKQQYTALPGDMATATKYWGIAAGDGSDSTCGSFVGSGTSTCNGNGDGVVYNNSGKPRESFRFWQHLANAELISGKYNGVSANGMRSSISVDNSPAGKVSSGQWYTDSEVDSSNNAFASFYAPPGPFFTTITYKNFFSYSAGSATGVAPITSGVLTAQEVYNIDAKVDDGKPATGTVVIRCSNVDLCTTAASASDTAAEYKLSYSSPDAIVIFNKSY